MTASLLETIERYYDQVPRAATRVEVLGPFTMFIKHGDGWPYYARPTIGARRFTVEDVERVRARQRELEVPESFEWVAETTPRLRAAIVASGLHAHAHPLMVLQQPLPASRVTGITARLIGPDEDLGRLNKVARLAFASPGTAVGDVGIAELESAEQGGEEEFHRERIRRGLTVTAGAFTAAGDPVAAGSHHPLDGVTEIVGVGTLPAFRRQGIAAALTSVLVEDAVRRVGTVFLSAGNDDVVRVYDRLGFRRVATACIAEPP